MVISPGGRRVSWLFFEGRAKRPYLNSYGPSESGGRRTEKQPTGRGPEGCVENGRLGETYQRIGVSAFTKRHQLRRDLLVIVATSKSSLTSPDADTPIRRPADTLPQPAAAHARQHKGRVQGMRPEGQKR
jgi:hypothetical protein